MPKLNRKVVRAKIALVDQRGYSFCMHLMVKKKLCSSPDCLHTRLALGVAKGVITTAALTIR